LAVDCQLIFTGVVTLFFYSRLLFVFASFLYNAWSSIFLQVNINTNLTSIIHYIAQFDINSSAIHVYIFNLMSDFLPDVRF
jgi:hypothetical protein